MLPGQGEASVIPAPSVRHGSVRTKSGAIPAGYADDSPLPADWLGSPAAMSAELTCYRHPGVAASNTCGVCLKTICDVCLTWANMAPACPICARKVRQGGRVKRMAIIATVVLLAGAGVLAYAFTYEPPFDYGKHANDVRTLSQRLEKEPCDRAAIVKLGDTMMMAGDYRGALGRANAWFAACGDHPRLLWVTYGAHKRLGENEAAIAAATKLIEDDPDDKDYWWWRGVIHERTGDWEKAAADYEKTLEIMPRISNIPFNLSAAYEKLGRPCDAVKPIEQYLEYHPQDREDASVQQQLARLIAACETPSAAAPAEPGDDEAVRADTRGRRARRDR